MFLAMNRFRIARGREEAFLEHWKKRQSYLGEAPGFIRFHLLKGESCDEYTLFASHVEWESAAAFEAWTKSEAFRKAHQQAAQTPRDFYVGPPQLEVFETVL
ncbi:MAG: antibiotic biosynthesis monooxygenase [Rhodocyclaceae bacterium]|nr:antibiotic biosynthesis monooxygenase [Rhodocyclaceae bacterium]